MELFIAWNILGVQSGSGTYLQGTVSLIPLNILPSFAGALILSSTPCLFLTEGPSLHDLCRLHDLPSSVSANGHCCNSPYPW